ncbi:hypothetical protein ACMG4P_01250 [Pseudovibrio denitrificans]|uniref:hypothetical protein n=1 Tax=Pseudovibrio denitrificans TaxID=258256 RepID=UPI0039BF1BBA
MAEALAGYGELLGTGFVQRSQEAIKCRNAQAWFACCAMAGAAAESVLLAVAIAKTDDEERVLREYRGANGRRNTLNLVAGAAPRHVREKLTTFSGIIGLWRDESAHGLASPISMANADEAMRQLLHMCQWVTREWDNLTRQNERQQ